MPARSKKQWRWMFANGMPFAHRWAHQRGYHSLPASKDAAPTAGAPLGGPGGLLGYPGLRKRLKDAGYGARAGQVIRGNLARGQGGQFTSAGNAGAKRTPATLSRASSTGRETLPKVKPLKPAKGRGGGGKGAGKKPKKTDEQRTQEREQARAQRRQEATAQQAKNITTVGDATGMGDDLSNLDQFSQGKGLRPQDVDNLVSQGLLERGTDGTPRMTGSGHALVTAARRGDTQGARDAMSRGADHAARRAELDKKRADAEAKKRDAEQKKLAKGGGGGGGSKKPSADDKRAAQQQQRAQTASATAGRVGLAANDLATLRQSAETGGASSPALSSLGLIGADGLATDQGRRALSALERGDVRGYNAALQDAKARQGRETAAAQRRQQIEGRRTRHEQERRAKQQRAIDAIKRRAQGGAKLTSSDIQKLQDAGALNAQGQLKAADPGDYLVVEDRTKPSTYHLQVRRNGTPDHRLMGAAWAALHGGYRGNVYAGPDKGKALDKLKALYRAEKMDLPAEKSFIVYKDASGAHRWLSRSTTAYMDRDHEIISTDALDTDSVRMTASKQFGPLRYWHVGQPDPFAMQQPWGPGLDIGDCDYSTLIGRVRIESGTFRDQKIAEKVAAQADQYELSPGFFHPADAPDADGVYHAIRTFERSIVPRRYGRASNLFTGLAVKESRMDLNEMERRFKTAIADLGLDAEMAAALGQQLVATEKAAAEQGIAYKSADVDPEYPDVVINGITYKAAPPPGMVEGSPEEEAAESPEEEAAEPDAGMDDGDIEALVDAIAQRTAGLVIQQITPIFGDMKLSEFKNLLSGMATKDAGHAAELAALKAQQAVLEAKIAQIEGDQPNTILPDDVAAALKSAGPQAPSDPGEAEVVNDPTRPYAAIAARTMPQLYKTTTDGAFNGWTPPPAS